MTILRIAQDVRGHNVIDEIARIEAMSKRCSDDEERDVNRERQSGKRERKWRRDRLRDRLLGLRERQSTELGLIRIETKPAMQCSRMHIVAPPLPKAFPRGNMNQIQPAPYQQPSFSHALGSYPQQPHFGPASSSSTSSASSPAVTAPQYSHIQSPSPSLPQSQSRSQSHPQLQHPLSVTYSQSPSASPSTQAFPSHANPISPSLASPIQQYQQQQQQQQQRYQHQLPQLQTQHHQTQLSAGNGGYPGTGVRNGATQASRSEQGSHTGEITPARSATFSPPAAATPTLSPGFSTQQQGSQKYPMAAPPLPQSAQRQQSPHGGSNPATSQPASPRTAASSALEKERVALLLEVNLLLLEELNNLLSQGKGGAVDAQQVALLRQQGMPEKRAADEYIQ
ncbi:hypothetical protein ANO11243_046110 [Dothideomycetidae sp. 11243]|nr:hypothetical protein ANO11243_046110 [fungal sp. No.11243]